MSTTKNSSTTTWTTERPTQGFYWVIPSGVGVPFVAEVVVDEHQASVYGPGASYEMDELGEGTLYAGPIAPPARAV